MALYRLALSTVRRSAGQSSVAAAAYRAGVRLGDQRTDLVHDYTRRHGIARAELVGWRGERAALWNAAEAAERRRDAVVAREVQVALPHELAAAERWAVTLALADWLHARYGVAVDVALPAPSRRGDHRNWHAHLLCTARAVAADGTLGAKTRVLDQRRTGRAEVEAMRARWAALLNGSLARFGAQVRVDHRSYARQGATRESEHLGRGALEHEWRGTRTALGDERRARAARNRTRQAAAHAAASRQAGDTPAPASPRRRRTR